VSSVLASIASMDDQAMLWLHAWLGRSPLFDRFAMWVLGEPLVKLGPLVLAICALWFRPAADRDAVRLKVVDALVAGPAGIVVGRVLAFALPWRERPIARPDLDYTVPLEPVLRTWSSFPSDHAVMAFALAASLLRISPRIGAWALAHAVVFVCLPRLYFGQHFPTDLIGGAIVGASLAAAVAHVPAFRPVGRAVLAIEARRPAWLYPTGFVLLFEIVAMFQNLRQFVAGLFRVLHDHI
jgi:membrane-associated phospholipid phosphatase